jgi:hypothetical protein
MRFHSPALSAETRHICAFCNNDEEEYRVLLPFIKEGFECGDKAAKSSTRINTPLISNDWHLRESI